jgi:NADH-quinone oxidoreductase subunit J
MSLLTGVVAAATAHPSSVDVGTFAVAAAIILAGAIGVVVSRNPVHAALMLVMTLFGVAVLFVLQRDPFLAAVQVIVYAGAIVVLFLFVIMFLGVDRQEDIATEPLRGQRPLAVALVVLGTVGLLLLGQVSSWTTGAPHVAGVAAGKESNVYLLGRSVYTTYLFPFEATAALLIIAVVGAVVLARRPPSSSIESTDESPSEAGTGPTGADDEVDATGTVGSGSGSGSGDIVPGTATIGPDEGDPEPATDDREEVSAPTSAVVASAREEGRT